MYELFFDSPMTLQLSVHAIISARLGQLPQSEHAA